MLVDFSVSNWRSIKNTQTLSLVMDKGGELAEENGFLPSVPATSALLRSAVIYGANAAGKSNFLRAVHAMKQVVLQSAKWQHGDVIPLIVPFRLDTQSEKAATVFEITFVAGGVRYQYGFAATVQRICEEWLFAYPNGRPQKWLGRAWNEESNEYAWERCAALTGQKQLWQDSTRENALFLSTAVQLNCKQLQPVYDWFKTTLRVANVTGWDSDFTASLCKEPAQHERITAFLKAADFDIQSVVIESEKITAEHLPDEMPDELKTILLSELPNHEVLKIKTVHQTADGRSVMFELEDESDGTQKFFAFAGPWLNALEHGYVLVIDELHKHLHPKMVQFLVQLFHNPESNPKNAQLIFTTHETSILNQEVFRRDQIWFCEKEVSQATKLFPLTDFSPRKGRENLEAHYLAGRYGALPYLRKLHTPKQSGTGECDGQ